MYGFPDIVGFYDMLYGTAGIDLGALTCLYYGGASGMVFSGNPPFSVTDFIQIIPKFTGPPTNYTGLTLTEDSSLISGFTNVTGLAIGQLVVNLNSVMRDSVITAIDTVAKTIIISSPVLGDDTTLTVYQAPLMPIIAMLSYTELAQASVMYDRYHEAWFMQMCNFIAHYCTLYMRAESGDPNLTASQAASSGLTKGIITHRAAGDVSATFKTINLDGYDQFGAWAETQYGELFMTMARGIAGAIWVP